jgi:hypothetical protein
MSRLVIRHVSFDHASVTNGFILPLRNDSHFILCSCPSDPQLHTSHANPPIGHESNLREWRGRVAVVEGTAGEFGDMLVREVKAEDWLEYKQQCEDNEAR